MSLEAPAAAAATALNPHTAPRAINLWLQARERDWANVITAHAGDPAAYTWRLAHFTLGEHALLPPDDSVSAQPAGQQQQQQQRAAVSAVAISACGNFGLVGNEAGRVDRYNLQSGLHRGTYARQHAAGERARAVEAVVVRPAAKQLWQSGACVLKLAGATS
jgi:hypothetical protein